MTANRQAHRNCPGRADPFGLLILAVIISVSVTMAVQVYANRADEGFMTDLPTASLSVAGRD